MFFASCAWEWYEWMEGRVSASTYANYHYTLNILLANFSMYELDAVTTDRVGGFLFALSAKCVSHSQASKCRSMLIQIFDYAIAAGYMEENPARAAKVVQHKPRRIQPTTKKKREETYSRAEVRYLLNTLPDNIIGCGILTMLGSGIHVQELLALTPNDIAEDGSVIYIRRAIQLVNGSPRMGEPYGPMAVRAVPVDKPMQAYAAKLRQYGLPDMDRLIWRSKRDSEVYDVGVFRKHLNKIKSDKLRILPPKACRATYIKNLELDGKMTHQDIALRVGNIRLM